MQEAINVISRQASAFDWSTLLIIAAVLIVLFILVRVCFAVKNRLKKQQEVKGLKKDLMIWSVLSRLVQGGQRTDEAKGELSFKLLKVEDEFKRGLTLVKRERRLGSRVPWLLVLGEPTCGKSALLEESRLGLRSAAEQPEDKSSVRFHIGQQAVFLDVSGRIFFDHWVGGSGAEFARLCALIAKKHHKKPLDGIVLCIPADALLADTPELTLKKAQLMAAELHRVTHDTAMHLPCTVVITKLDTVLGFREYFAELPEQLEGQLLGFAPGQGTAEQAAEAFFDSFGTKLAEGVLAAFDGRTAAELSLNDRSRLEATALVYLFPGEFAELRKNLIIYLHTIFRGDELAADRAFFNGCFFTSVRDDGCCLNQRLAALQGKSIDEAVYVDPNPVRSRPLFVRQLLLQLPAVRRAFFTKREQVRRAVPLTVLTVLLGLLSAVYLYGAFYTAPRLNALLADETAYYEGLSRLFAQGVIDGAPLFAVGPDGHGLTLFDEPMPHDSGITRLGFFNQAKLRLQQRYEIPWQFLPFSFFKFGLGHDTILADRRFIYDEVQTRMVFLPLVRGVQHSLRLDLEEPFSKERRDALFSFTDIAFFTEKNAGASFNAAYDDAIAASFMDYLYPELGTALKQDLTMFLPQYDFFAKATNDAVVLSPSYGRICTKALNALQEDWRTLAIYPESGYQVIRRGVEAGSRLLDFYTWVLSLKEQGLSALSPEQAAELYQEYAARLEGARAAGEALNSIVRSALLHSEGRANAAAQDGAAEAQEGQQTQFIDSAYAAYLGSLNEDAAFFRYFDRERTASGGRAEQFHGVDAAAFLHEEERIKAALAAQYEDLKQSFIALRRSPCFAAAYRDERTQNYVLNYELMLDFLSLSLLPEAESDLTSLQGSFERLQQVQQSADEQQAKLEDYVKNHPEFALGPQLLPSCSAMLTLQRERQEIELYERILSFYPDDRSVSGMLAALSMRVGVMPFNLDAGGLDFSLERAVDTLGYFSLREEYNPQGLLYYLRPVSALVRLKNDPKLAKTPSGVYLQQSAKLQLAARTLGLYAQSFIKYWSEMADAVYPQAHDFMEFHDLADRSRAYEINAQLQNLYELSNETIAQVDDVLLSKSALVLKQQALQRLENRLQQFAPELNDDCADRLTLWSSLPYDALEAGVAVQQSEPDSDLAQLLTQVKPGGLPWWQRFEGLGRGLLKSNVREQGRLTFADLLYRLNVFPLSADADPAQAATPAQLAQLRSDFVSLGLNRLPSGTAAAAAAPAPSAARGDILSTVITNPELQYDLLPKIDALLQSLGTAGKVKSYELTLLDAAAQRDLLKQSGLSLPLAALRYRYVSAGGDSFSLVGQNLKPSSGREVSLLQGTVDDAGLHLDFYRYSTDREPAASFDVAGGYDALQLYLSGTALYDAKAGCSYLPLILNDAQLGQSVYFIKLTLSGELPAPEDWPRSADFAQQI